MVSVLRYVNHLGYFGIPNFTVHFLSGILAPKMKDKIVYTVYQWWGQVLTEQRPIGKYAGENIFPGGNIEPTDPTIAAAFLREFGEETGAKPTSYYRCSSVKLPSKGIRLHPFMVVSWQGDIPRAVLDNHNPLEWKDLIAMMGHSNPDVAMLANIFFNLTHTQHA